MSKRKLPPIAPGIAVGAAAGSVAFAAIPDGNGAIHGCYGKPGSLKPGLVRLIDPSKSETCHSNETPPDWTQAGQPGQKGEKGDKGDTGQPGQPGQLQLSRAYVRRLDYKA